MASVDPTAQTPPHPVVVDEALYLTTQAVLDLLVSLGEDTLRPGLVDTPARVARAWREMTSGYREDPAEILSRRFPAPGDDLVLLTGIRFTSICEHHLLPFVGTAAIAYLPNGEIVGISKLVRLLDCFARRLQVQEQLASQIVDALMAHLQPKGAAVLLSAHHQCMGCRGVRQQDARMVTTALRGAFRDKPSLQAEFLQTVIAHNSNPLP